MGDETRGIANVWLRSCVSPPSPLCHLVIFDLILHSRGQSSVVAGLFLLTVPTIQLKGRMLRVGIPLSPISYVRLVDSLSSGALLILIRHPSMILSFFGSYSMH
jgi:hypothetical protein